MEDKNNLSENRKSAAINMIFTGAINGGFNLDVFLSKKNGLSEDYKNFLIMVYEDIQKIIEENGKARIKEDRALQEEIKKSLYLKYEISEEFINKKSQDLKEKAKRIKEEVARKAKTEDIQKNLTDSPTSILQDMQKKVNEWNKQKKDLKEQIKVISEMERPKKSEKKESMLVETGTEVDFSSLYMPDHIKSSEDGYKRINYKTDHAARSIQLSDGKKRIFITPMGELRYITAFGLDSYIEKYMINMYDSTTGELYNSFNGVYSIIDLVRAQKDEEYKKAVLEQLLTTENMKREDSKGYIGQLYSKKDKDKIRYELYYSAEEYTAIKTYEEQREKQLADILEEFGGKKDEERDE